MDCSVTPHVERESLQQRSTDFSDNEKSYEVYTRDPMMNQPSPENVKCNTPELERKNILTMVRTLLIKQSVLKF